MAEEKTPLLSASQNNAGPSSYDGIHQAIEQNEHENISGGVPMVTCRVCQAMINIADKGDQYVVKCSECKEATPIKNAPPGKKYVRCPCNCLLICTSSATRTACPRENCKKIINFLPSANQNIPTVPGMCRVTCAHCSDVFIYNTLNNAFAKCPHCKKLSSVGPDYARYKGIIHLVLAIIFLIIGVIVIVTTVKYVAKNPAIYVAYISYFCSMKISVIEGPQ